MKKLLFIICLISAICLPKLKAENGKYFNDNWQFTLSDSVNYSLENYKSPNWRNVTLPHDWSVEFEFDSINGEPNTGLLLGGKAWYAKTFETPITKNQKCFIIFGGVYNNASFWINGRKLGDHPYGYSPFYFDITKYLRADNGVQSNKNLKPEMIVKTNYGKNSKYISEADQKNTTKYYEKNVVENEGGANRLSVKVDHSRYADCRWYTGSGIYRNVRIMITDKCYIPVWGTYITTPKVSKKVSKVALKIDLKNEYNTDKKVLLTTEIKDAQGNVVAKKINKLNLAPAFSQTKALATSKTIEQNFSIRHPKLWDVNSPNMYKAITTLSINNKIVQTYNTPFGIRSIHFDKDKGFFLNGKNMKVKGVCLHHDGGLVGAAVPKGVWRRRLALLKEGGCNAIRTAHNPVSDEFLSLCDEMGFLVQEEFFDEWDYPKDKRKNMMERSIDYRTRGYVQYFQEWSEKDIQTTMLRSRNHPSIFQWSIGNEIEWTYKRARDITGYWRVKGAKGYFNNLPPFSKEKIREESENLPRTENYEIGKTAQRLADCVRKYDRTRPVTANCILPTGSFEDGYADALDIVGFSYRRAVYDYAHKNYPDKIIMGTENAFQWCEWKPILDRDFVAGTFYWTGIDYMGESHSWAEGKGRDHGLLDYAGFAKPAFYNMKAIWAEKPCLAIFSQTEEKSLYKSDSQGNVIEKRKDSWMHRGAVFADVNQYWNYKKGEKNIVEIYSNCDEVELFQDGKTLGKIRQEDCIDHIYKWSVTYHDGQLKAIGTKRVSPEMAKELSQSHDKSISLLNNVATITKTLETVGAPAAVKLSCDKKEMRANGKEVMHVVAQLVDAQGREVRNVESHISFIADGTYKLLGVDNGYVRNYTPYKSTAVDTWHGQALLILQSKKNSFSNEKSLNNNISVRAITQDGLISQPISVKIINGK